MFDRPQIAIRGLEKEFRDGRAGGTILHRLRETSQTGTSGTLRKAIAGIDLEVMPGELVGLIGNNGAGKTTLLKTVAGLYKPSRGSVEVHGRVIYLAGLGVGMMTTLSVRRNIYLYGTIYGLPRVRLDELYESILAWAELTEYAATPVSKLSQGMKARLAFAVAQHIDAEVVLMDEAFSAGDERFRRKTEEFFAQEVRGQRSIVVSTHSLPFVRTYCTRAVWMEQGKLVECGEPEEVVDRYIASSKRK